jgi:hypothetical protein
MSSQRRRSRAKTSSHASNRSSQNGRHSRRRQHQPADGASFWGDPAKLPAAQTNLRMTTDPAAVPRSLGPPPLPGHQVIAEHYLDAVYERAVTTAGALAAAGGLIDPEELAEELGQ